MIDNCVNKLIDCIKNFKDFALITPEDTNNEIYKNYETNNSKANLKTILTNFQEVEYVDLTWLINRLILMIMIYGMKKFSCILRQKIFQKELEREIKKFI